MLPALCAWVGPPVVGGRRPQQRSAVGGVRAARLVCWRGRPLPGVLVAGGHVWVGGSNPIAARPRDPPHRRGLSVTV